MFHPQRAHCQRSLFTKICSTIVLLAFLVQSLFPTPSLAQTIAQLKLPAPGSSIQMTGSFQPLMLRGLTPDPKNPLQMDFIVNAGDSGLAGKNLEDESLQLVRYFLAALTVPENEMWVNLSPAEPDRIMPPTFGETEMGRDLLAQDYVLKQLTSSLLSPDGELGKKFWDKVYEKVYDLQNSPQPPLSQRGGVNSDEQALPPLYERGGERSSGEFSNDIIESFNKIWIVPQKARVYEHNGTAFVIESKLKVLMEEDYLVTATGNRQPVTGKNEAGMPAGYPLPVTGYQDDIQEMIRRIILPAIEDEVNNGEHFAKLRQIYNAMILAHWYKQNLKNTLLAQVYVDQGKTDGVDVDDKTIVRRIYEEYLEAFRKGASDVIREEYDPVAQEMVARKYFTGGADMGMLLPRAFSQTSNLFGINAASLVSDNITFSVGFANQADYQVPAPVSRAIMNEEGGSDIWGIIVVSLLSLAFIAALVSQMRLLAGGIAAFLGLSLSFATFLSSRGGNRAMLAKESIAKMLFNVSAAGAFVSIGTMIYVLSLSPHPDMAAVDRYLYFSTFFLLSAFINDIWLRDFSAVNQAMLFNNEMDEMFAGEPEVAGFIKDVIINVDGTRNGIVSQPALDKLRTGSPSEIPDEIHHMLEVWMLKHENEFRGAVIDGKSMPVGQFNANGLMLYATSVGNHENIDRNKGYSTSFEIFKDVGGRPEIVASVQVIWGLDIRVIVAGGLNSEQGPVFKDYILSASGSLEPVGEKNNMPDQLKENGTVILSIAGNSREFSPLMKKFRLQLDGKHRFSDDPQDEYLPIKKDNGFLEAPMTRHALLGLGLRYRAVNGRAMVETLQGLIDPLEAGITWEQLDSRDLVYGYAGSKDWMGKLEKLAADEPGLVTPMTLAPPAVKEPTTREWGKEFDFEVQFPKKMEEMENQFRRGFFGTFVDRVIKRLVRQSYHSAFAVQFAYTHPVALGISSTSPEELKKLGKRAKYIRRLLKQQKIMKIEFFYQADDGKMYIRSGEDIIRQLGVRAGEEVDFNNSGDPQIALDRIYNEWLNFIIATYISTGTIISEEEGRPIYLGLGRKYGQKMDQLSVSSDPVDGSDFTKTGGVPVTLLQWVALRAMKMLQDLDVFNFGLMEISLLHHSLHPALVLSVNGEVEKYVLTGTGEDRKFRRHFSIFDMLERELARQNWIGLMPEPAAGRPMVIAQGGSPFWLMKNPLYDSVFSAFSEIYGDKQAFTGSMGVDVMNIMMEQNAVFVFYAYIGSKLRQAFEGTWVGKAMRRLRGLALNSDSEMLNFSFPEDESQITKMKTDFLFGSAAPMRFIQAYRQHVKENVEKEKWKGVLTKQYALDFFWETYIPKTRQLINQLLKKYPDSFEAKTDKEKQNNVIRALFKWRERPGEMTWWQLINSNVETVHNELFPAQDNAMLPGVELVVLMILIFLVYTYRGEDGMEEEDADEAMLEKGPFQDPKNFFNEAMLSLEQQKHRTNLKALWSLFFTGISVALGVLLYFAGFEFAVLIAGIFVLAGLVYFVVNILEMGQQLPILFNGTLFPDVDRYPVVFQEMKGWENEWEPVFPRLAPRGRMWTVWKPKDGVDSDEAVKKSVVAEAILNAWIAEMTAGHTKYSKVNLSIFKMRSNPGHVILSMNFEEEGKKGVLVEIKRDLQKYLQAGDRSAVLRSGQFLERDVMKQILGQLKQWNVFGDDFTVGSKWGPAVQKKGKHEYRLSAESVQNGVKVTVEDDVGVYEFVVNKNGVDDILYHSKAASQQQFVPIKLSVYDSSFVAQAVEDAFQARQETAVSEAMLVQDFKDLSKKYRFSSNGLKGIDWHKGFLEHIFKSADHRSAVRDYQRVLELHREEILSDSEYREYQDFFNKMLGAKGYYVEDFYTSFLAEDLVPIYYLQQFHKEDWESAVAFARDHQDVKKGFENLAPTELFQILNVASRMAARSLIKQGAEKYLVWAQRQELIYHFYREILVSQKDNLSPRDVRVLMTGARDIFQSNRNTASKRRHVLAAIRNIILSGLRVFGLETAGGNTSMGFLLDHHGVEKEDTFENLFAQTNLIKSEMRRVVGNSIPKGYADWKALFDRYRRSQKRKILSDDELIALLNRNQIDPEGEQGREIIRLYHFNQEMLYRGPFGTSLARHPKLTHRKAVRAYYRNGVDVFRIFLADDNPEEIREIMDLVRELGPGRAKIQVVVHYTDDFPKGVDGYLEIVNRMLKDFPMEYIDSIVVKDAPGIIIAKHSGEIARRLREQYPETPIHFHSHTTSGQSGMAYAEAVRMIGKGPIVLDAAFSREPYGQPSFHLLYKLFKDTPWAGDLNIGDDAKREAEARVRDNHKDLPDVVELPLRIIYKMFQAGLPGGMFSYFYNNDLETQARTLLKHNWGGELVDEKEEWMQAGHTFKMAIFEAALEEVIVVKTEMGHLSRVTPYSNWIGFQSIRNVVRGLSADKPWFDFKRSGSVMRFTKSRNYPKSIREKYRNVGNDITITLANILFTWPQSKFLQEFYPTMNFDLVKMVCENHLKKIDRQFQLNDSDNPSEQIPVILAAMEPLVPLAKILGGHQDGGRRLVDLRAVYYYPKYEQVRSEDKNLRVISEQMPEEDILKVMDVLESLKPQNDPYYELDLTEVILQSRIDQWRQKYPGMNPKKLEDIVMALFFGHRAFGLFDQRRLYKYLWDAEKFPLTQEEKGRLALAISQLQIDILMTSGSENLRALFERFDGQPQQTRAAYVLGFLMANHQLRNSPDARVIKKVARNSGAPVNNAMMAKIVRKVSSGGKIRTTEVRYNDGAVDVFDEEGNRIVPPTDKNKGADAIDDHIGTEVFPAFGRRKLNEEKDNAALVTALPEKAKSDKAMPADLNPNNTGGIDLSPQFFETFEVERSDSGMLTAVNGRTIAEINANINGLHPFIIKVTPMADAAMLQLLGLADEAPADSAPGSVPPMNADQKFLAAMKES